VVDIRFGGIKVFGYVLIGFQGTAPESNDISRKGMNGEDDPSGKAVKKILIPFNGQSGPDQVAFLVSAFTCFSTESCSGFRAVAELKFLDDVIPETALSKITQAYGPAFIGVEP